MLPDRCWVTIVYNHKVAGPRTCVRIFMTYKTWQQRCPTTAWNNNAFVKKLVGECLSAILIVVFLQWSLQKWSVWHRLQHKLFIIVVELDRKMLYRSFEMFEKMAERLGAFFFYYWKFRNCWYICCYLIY